MTRVFSNEYCWSTYHGKDVSRFVIFREEFWNFRRGVFSKPYDFSVFKKSSLPWAKLF